MLIEQSADNFSLMRITQWGEYGIHCAAFIALRQKEGAKSVSAQEISESQNIDIQYAQQILQRLRRNDIVQSIRGPQGGYHLSRPPSEVSLKEILQAAEGDTFEIICEAKPINDQRCTPESTCALRPIWQQLKVHINDFLGSISLASLIENTQPSDTPIKISASVQAGSRAP